MKRIFGALAALLLLFGAFVTVSADTESARDLAVIKLGSAGEGSTVNYFVLRTVMGYCDEDGVCKGELFDGVVFEESQKTNTPEKAEVFIDELTLKGGALASAEQAARELEENGYLEKGQRYPVYVSFPNATDFFETEEEIKEFCAYFIDTLVFAFEFQEYEDICLKGMYFGDGYDENEKLRSFCISLAKEKGLECVAVTAEGHPIEADKVYASNKQFEDRFGAVEHGGVVLPLDGVPTDEDNSSVKKLLENAIEFSEFDGSAPLLFTFEAFNNLYDCAIATAQDFPNENGRLAYDCVKDCLKRDFEGLRSVYKELKSADNSASEDNLPLNIIFSTALCAAGAGAISYILIRKAKRNGK
ncbi:MAG: DUF4855 domain-containing protein [Clostridia bacterium]|nr:DUF4855 domain-containing protein [Clostridia bacterium]